MVEGFNQGSNARGTGVYFNGDANNSEISLWGRVVRYDEDGIVHDAQFGDVGRLELVQALTRELLPQCRFCWERVSTPPIAKPEESAHTSFFSRISRGDYVSSMVLKAHFEPFSQVLSETRLTALGDSLVKENRPFERQRVCGDSLVRQIDYSATLYVAMSFVGESREATERFRQRVTASALWGLVSKTETREENFDDFAEKVMVRVEALQEGGNVDALERVIPAGAKTECNLADVAPCLASMRAYISHAKGDFILQIQQARENGYAGLYPLRYYTDSYEDSGLEELAGLDSPGSNIEQFRSVRLSLEREKTRYVQIREQEAILLQCPLTVKYCVAPDAA